MVRRTTSVFVVALLAMVMLAACGTEQGSGEKPTVTRVAESYTPPPATEVPAETGEPTAEGGVAPATEVDVEMVDIAFTQTELTIAANTDVTINLVNNGMSVHNLHIEGTDFKSADFNAGESGELVVNLAPGEYVYFCAVPGHKEAGMVGKLIVTDGAAAGGASAEPTAEAGASGDAAALPTVFDVEMVDIAFTQTELTIPANTDVTFKLVNNGAAQHNLHIEGTDFKSADYNGGESGEMVVNLPAGEYVYFCAVPGHKEAGMVGKLIVVDGSASAGSADAGASAEVTAEATEETAAAGAEPVTEVTISMVDIAFDPTEITIPADTDVTITLVNNGAAVHAFKIDALGISSKELAAGESETIVINVAAGEYDFHCPIPGHTEAGMVGKLIVK